MNNKTLIINLLYPFSLLFFGVIPNFLAAQYNPNLMAEAQKVMLEFKEKDAKFNTFFEDAYGYVVFPKVAKGGYFIGGAGGKGIAFEQGEPVGKVKIKQISIGFQFGGQSFSQLIFFETEADFLRFKANKLEFAGQFSAVAIAEGVSANLAYSDGVAVFTKTRGGLMFEAALGGQKMKFKPYKKKKRKA